MKSMAGKLLERLNKINEDEFGFKQISGDDLYDDYGLDSGSDTNYIFEHSLDSDTDVLVIVSNKGENPNPKVEVIISVGGEIDQEYTREFHDMITAKNIGISIAKDLQKNPSLKQFAIRIGGVGFTRII